MIRFLLGFLFIQLGVFGVMVGANIYEHQIGLSSMTWRDLAPMVLTLILLPIAAAWLAISVLELIRPRRIFDRRVRRPIARLLLGAAAALVATLLTTIAVATLPSSISDSVITSSAAFLGACGVTLFSSRHRKGTCIHCAYDLSATPPTQPCPECGAALVV